MKTNPILLIALLLAGQASANLIDPLSLFQSVNVSDAATDINHVTSSYSESRSLSGPISRSRCDRDPRFLAAYGGRTDLANRLRDPRAHLPSRNFGLYRLDAGERIEHQSAIRICSRASDPNEVLRRKPLPA